MKRSNRTNTYEHLTPVKRRRLISSDKFIENCLKNGYRIDVATAGVIHLTTRPKVY